MAFCNNPANCGHTCGRQDDHGGDCDCYEEACCASSRFKPPPPPPPLATFYAVRNHEGKFYRTYSKHGSTGWHAKLSDARLWTTIGQARGKITALSNAFPKEPVPELVEFVVTVVNVVDQRDRVALAREKKAREDAALEVIRKNHAVKAAERELERAQARLKGLTGG